MSDLNTTKIQIMATDIQYLKAGVERIEKSLQKHTDEENLIWEKVMNHITVQMNTKADVWVEKIFRYILMTVGGILIAVATYLFLHFANIIQPIT